MEKMLCRYDVEVQYVEVLMYFLLQKKQWRRESSTEFNCFPWHHFPSKNLSPTKLLFVPIGKACSTTVIIPSSIFPFHQYLVRMFLLVSESKFSNVVKQIPDKRRCCWLMALLTKQMIFILFSK